MCPDDAGVSPPPPAPASETCGGPELRTPLTVVLGYLEMLGDAPLTSEQQHMVHTMTRAAHRLEHLAGLLSRGPGRGGRVRAETRLVAGVAR